LYLERQWDRERQLTVNHELGAAIRQRRRLLYRIGYDVGLS